jgi:hypothetical protein
MPSTKQLAHRAGFLYLLMAFSAPYGLMYVPSRLIVSGDAAATAERVRSGEAILRLGIASELFHQAVGVFLVLALYRLFRPVDDVLAKHLVALGALVSVPIMFVNVLNEIAASTLMRGADFLAAIDGPQREALGYLFLRLHSRGVDVASIFWGLWLFPFGLLVIRSRFLPRVLGYLLLVAGVGYLAAATAKLVLPQYVGAIGKVALPLEMGELPIILWLAIRGAREPAAPSSTREMTAAATVSNSAPT